MLKLHNLCAIECQRGIPSSAGGIMRFTWRIFRGSKRFSPAISSARSRPSSMPGYDFRLDLVLFIFPLYNGIELEFWLALLALLFCYGSKFFWNFGSFLFWCIHFLLESIFYLFLVEHTGVGPLSNGNYEFAEANSGKIWPCFVVSFLSLCILFEIAMALQEIKGVIQIYKELIKCNRDILGTITVKIQEHENQFISQNETITGILAHLNQ
jgi:hypothetical protein